MCPRDKHDRARGIMCGHDAYEKRAGEGGPDRF